VTKVTARSVEKKCRSGPMRTRCPRCGMDHWEGTIEYTPCPHCGNQLPCLMHSHDCRSVKLIIAGESYYQCFTLTACNKCDGEFWQRLRVATYCKECKLHFDFSTLNSMECARSCGPHCLRVNLRASIQGHKRGSIPLATRQMSHKESAKIVKKQMIEERGEDD
jgi:hypothetical protein